MSDVESDHENGLRTGNHTYKIASVWWRSKTHQFLTFLKLLDLMHMSTKFKWDETPNSGNWLQVQICQDMELEPEYQTNSVSELLANFYDDIWLQTLQEMIPKPLRH